MISSCVFVMNIDDTFHEQRQLKPDVLNFCILKFDEFLNFGSQHVVSEVDIRHSYNSGVYHKSKIFPRVFSENTIAR